MAWKNDGVVGGYTAYKVDPKKIKIEKDWNPREDFGDIENLKSSIKENGILNALRVRSEGDDIYLVDGERRLRAVTELIKDGIEILSVPCVREKDSNSETERMVSALAANDGKPLTFFEEANAFSKLVKWGMSQTDIAKRIGRDPAYVHSRIKVMTGGCPDLLRALRNGEINQSTAIEIVIASDKVSEQTELLKQQIGRTAGKNRRVKKEGSIKKTKTSSRRGSLSFKELELQIELAESLEMNDIAIGLKIAARIVGQLLPSGQFDTVG